MKRTERLKTWLRHQVERFTWPWIVSRTGLAGLIFMLFNPENATPYIVVAFAAMVGIKPMADFDKFLSRDDKKGGPPRA